MRGRASWCVAVALAALCGLPGAAAARAEAEVRYTREQAFSAALRYLRVDLSYEVTEKDPQAAYLLFSFSDPALQKKIGHGSIELVQRDKVVRVLVSLPALPSYREELLKRGLLEKLRTEYGEPPAPAPSEPPKKAPAKPDDPPPPPDGKEPPPEEPKG